MTFRQNHEPKSFNDLIFHDPAVEQILREYADGQRTKHLILHGPKGSGKSCAAQMILKSRLPENFGDVTTKPLNGRTDRKRKNLPRDKQGENPASIRMRTRGWGLAGRA